MKAGQKLQLGGDLRSAGSTTLSAGAEGITAKSILTNEDLDIRSQGNISLEQAQAARDVRLESSTGSIATGNLLAGRDADRKSTRLNSSHSQISYAVFCLKKKKKSKVCYS